MKKIKQILAAVISVMMIISATPITAVNAEEIYHSLELDTPYKMTVSSDGETVSFTPKYEGWFRFYTLGRWDTYATLKDEYGSTIIDNDNSNSGANFLINYKLYPGNTYYLDVNAYVYEGHTAKFELIVEESVGAESVEIIKEPDNPTFVIGYEAETLSCEGMELLFTMSNGSTVLWRYGYGTDNVGLSNVEIRTYRSYGGVYCADIRCEEAYVSYSFTPIENPVDYIEYSGSPIVYYENSNGYYDDYFQHYYYYYNLPSDANIIVHYKDGTTAQAPVYAKLKEAHSHTSSDQNYNPWEVGDNNYVTLHYLNATDKIPVTIVESPVSYIQILAEPTVKKYEDYYHPILNGMKIKVVDKDGSSDTVTLSDENTRYLGEGTLGYAVSLGDRELTISYEYDETLGQVYILYCQGTEVKYSNCIFTPTREVTALSAENISPDGDGMKVTVNYADNSTDTLTLDVLDYFSSPDGSYYGYAMTENGIAYYSMEPVYETYKFVGYYFSMLYKTVFLEAPDYTIGDADNNGVVTINDATAIQLYLIEKQEFNSTQKYVADVNNDGEITVDDVTNIQLYVAKLKDSF